jgi:hypothetical protein
MQNKFVLWAKQKMTKSNIFGDLKRCIIRSRCLSILCSLKYKYLKLIFCMYLGYIIGYIRIFFSISLELVNVIFYLILKWDHWCPGAKNLHYSMTLYDANVSENMHFKNQVFLFFVCMSVFLYFTKLHKKIAGLMLLLCFQVCTSNFFLFFVKLSFVMFFVNLMKCLYILFACFLLLKLA